MAIMESTWYLPEEALKAINYPEVVGVMSQVSDIMDYAMRVNNALTDYNSGTFDKIDVDVLVLQNYISLCRSVADTLGHADNVCFDLITELREVQRLFQSLVYVRNRYGNQYIGTPTDTMTTTDNDTI